MGGRVRSGVWYHGSMIRQRSMLALVALLGAFSFLSPSYAEEEKAKTPARKAAPATPRVPMLWEVDTKPKIYLFGTIHIADPRVLSAGNTEYAADVTIVEDTAVLASAGGGIVTLSLPFTNVNGVFPARGERVPTDSEIVVTFNRNINEDSIAHQCMITHLKFFAQRVVMNEHNVKADEALNDFVRVNYPRAYECALIIKSTH